MEPENTKALRGAGALERFVRPVCWLEMLGFVPHPNLRPYAYSDQIFVSTDTPRRTKNVATAQTNDAISEANTPNPNPIHLSVVCAC